MRQDETSFGEARLKEFTNLLLDFISKKAVASLDAKSSASSSFNLMSLEHIFAEFPASDVEGGLKSTREFSLTS